MITYIRNMHACFSQASAQMTSTSYPSLDLGLPAELRHCMSIPYLLGKRRGQGRDMADGILARHILGSG